MFVLFLTWNQVTYQSIILINLYLDIDDVNKALGELHDDLELKVPTREFKEALSE